MSATRRRRGAQGTSQTAEKRRQGTLTSSRTEGEPIRGWTIIVVGVAVAAGLFVWHRSKHSGVGGSTVAAAAQAKACFSSGYSLRNGLTGANETIFDCSFADGFVRCVTDVGGIATDATANVQVLFANASGKPPCLTGQL